MAKKIYVDMDGTLCKFEAVPAIEKQYEKGFFEKEKPYENVIDGIREYMARHQEQVFSVISPIHINSRYIITEKRKWIEANIPEIKRCIFYSCGEDMIDYITNGIDPEDVLIDDYIPNLSSWPGIAIRLLNDVCDDHDWNGPVISIYDKSFGKSLEEIVKTKKK